MDGWTAFLSSLSSDKHMICATVRLYSVKQLEEFRPGLAGPESAHTHTHTHTQASDVAAAPCAGAPRAAHGQCVI